MIYLLFAIFSAWSQDHCSILSKEAQEYNKEQEQNYTLPVKSVPGFDILSGENSIKLSANHSEVDLIGSLGFHLKGNLSLKKFVKSCSSIGFGDNQLSHIRGRRKNKNHYYLDVEISDKTLSEAFKRQNLAADNLSIKFVVIDKAALFVKNQFFPSTYEKSIKKLKSQVYKALASQEFPNYRIDLSHNDDLVCDLLMGRMELSLAMSGSIDQPLYKKVDGPGHDEVMSLYKGLSKELESVRVKEEQLFVSGAMASEFNFSTEYSKAEPYSIVKGFFTKEGFDFEIPNTSLVCLAQNKSKYSKNRELFSIVSKILFPQIHQIKY